VLDFSDLLPTEEQIQTFRAPSTGGTPKTPLTANREWESYSPPTSPTNLGRLVLNDSGTVYPTTASPQRTQKNDLRHEPSNWLASVVATLPAEEIIAGDLTPQYYKAQQEYLQLFDGKDLMKALLSAVRDIVEMQRWRKDVHAAHGGAEIVGEDAGIVTGMPLRIIPWAVIDYSMLDTMSPMALRSGILQALKAIKGAMSLTWEPT